MQDTFIIDKKNREISENNKNYYENAIKRHLNRMSEHERQFRRRRMTSAFFCLLAGCCNIPFIMANNSTSWVNWISLVFCVVMSINILRMK